MDYACPGCHCSLKKQRPKFAPQPGQRRLLPSKAGLVCRRCNVRLELNLHPIEKRARYIDLAVFCVLIVFAASGSFFSYPLVVALLWGGLTEIGLSIWSRKHLRTWSRYAIDKS